jgi:hypothetical protein
MKYPMLDRSGRHELMQRLEAMGDFLARRFEALTEDEATAPGPGGTFSPVEQCWHLADLEREGFGERIRRLLAEERPFLPDFDGARVARERQYRGLSLAAGLEAFRAARAANLAALRALGPQQWERAGEQEGVGAVALCDLPQMMAEHDAAHRAEIEG